TPLIGTISPIGHVSFISSLTNGWPATLDSIRSRVSPSWEISCPFRALVLTLPSAKPPAFGVQFALGEPLVSPLQPLKTSLPELLPAASSRAPSVAIVSQVKVVLTLTTSVERLSAVSFLADISAGSPVLGPSIQADALPNPLQVTPKRSPPRDTLALPAV